MRAYGDDAILAEIKGSAKEERKILFDVYRHAYVARLAEVLAETPEVSKVLDSKALRDLETPEGYLGVADALRKRLLSPDGKD